MTKHELGDRVTLRPTMDGGGAATDVPRQGEIVYIHPAGRYYTVRFFLPHGTFCESYLTAPGDR